MNAIRRQTNLSADLVYPGEKPREGAVACEIGRHIKFDAEALEGFAPSTWQPIIYDVMLIVAAVEACDYSRTRSKIDWARNLSVRIPVHEVDRWNDTNVQQELTNTLRLLTGDNWFIEFRKTPEPQTRPAQSQFDFPHHADSVVPYSDGLDSKAVTGILSKTRPTDTMVRVRVGASRIKKPKIGERAKPFENVPFRVGRIMNGNGESSGRSRGFKFAVLSGLAAHLVGAKSVIVPESGQGAIGPTLANVGQSYFDRRSHPKFTKMVSSFLEALLDDKITFEHPVIFSTKGQTLGQFRRLFPEQDIWANTRSCWMDQRQASVNQQLRQCGVCAACMLRRLSLHAAGYDEPSDRYVWEDLGAKDFRSGASKQFSTHNNAQWEYALAGTLHLDHLASLKSSENLDDLLLRQAIPIADSLGLEVDDTKGRIKEMINVHTVEWLEFLNDLPDESFVRGWAEAR